MNERVHPLSIRTFTGTSDSVGTEKERTSWRNAIGEEKEEKAVTIGVQGFVTSQRTALSISAASLTHFPSRLIR